MIHAIQDLRNGSRIEYEHRLIGRHEGEVVYSRPVRITRRPGTASELLRALLYALRMTWKQREMLS